jgi:hypothetical protein
MARGEVAVEFSGSRLRAVHATLRNGRARIRRIVSVDVPPALDRDDAAAFGRWLKEVWSEHRLPRTGVTVALAREHVGLKRLTLPTRNRDELPQMTRMALQRELPFDADRAAIDYIIVKQENQSTSVLAAAAPESAVEFIRSVAKTAGVKVQRIGLRVLGTALLLRTRAMEQPRCVLAIDATRHGVEFCVLDHGVIRFSRAAALTRDGDDDNPARAVVTEARRSWMSYRIVESERPVEHAIVMSEPGLAADAAEPIGEMLRVDVEVLTEHPLVDSPDLAIGRAWPLVGMLLERERGEAFINFLAPRKPRDRHADIRRGGLAAAGIVIVGLGAMWTFGQRETRSLQIELDRLRSKRSDLMPEVAQYQREFARFTHIHEWEAVSPDWLDHMLYLETMLPEPERAVLDRWVGSLEFRGVEYDRREKEWSAPAAIGIVIDGEAVDRATADDVRERLVESAPYVTIASGADAPGGRRLPFGFSFRVRTLSLDPLADEEGEDAGDERTAASSSESDRRAQANAAGGEG